MYMLKSITNLVLSQFFFKSSRTLCNMVSSLKLTDYDVVGLDLDNTLLEYNLTNLFNLQYDFLANYLTNKKGYNKTVFPKKLSEDHVDFIRRGLFLDFRRGNLLHLRNDGYILKATHGSKEMDNSLIEKFYGKERRWSVTEKFVDNLFSLWDCEETRSFLDFTDSVATLLFAKAVDAVDLQGQQEEYMVWPDLLEAIVEMYQQDSSFSQTIASNLSDYIKPCEEDVLNWLRSLKKFSKVILITGSEIEVAKTTLPLCLGENYKQFFDLIIYNARKPGFFNQKRPFLTTGDEQVHNITLGKEYKQGNWSSLYKMFEQLLEKTPNCLYIGDNPVQDIYTPARISEKMDVIAMVEEVAADGLYPGYPEHPHSKYISSKFWDSFLYSNRTLTFFGGVIKTQAKLIIPSLKVLAEKPIDYEHKCVIWEE